VFTEELREQYLRDYGSHLPANRPECFALATAEDRQAQRQWVNAALRLLPEPGRSSIFGHLLNSRRFLQSYHELAVGDILMDAGYQVEYEPDLGGFTPDLVARNPDGTVRAIFEVANRLLPKKVDAEARGWEHVRSRILRIPIPWLIQVSREDGSTAAPDVNAEKWIAHELQRCLSASDLTVGDSFQGERCFWTVVQQLPGTHADLVIPRREVWANSDKEVAPITQKVNTYAPLVTKLGVPFIVVVAADPRHSIGLATIRSAMEGKLTLTVNLNPFHVGPSSSGPIKWHRTDQIRKWDPALSAVAWLDAGIDHPGTLTILDHQFRHLSAGLPIGNRIIQG
jgi:hypothetical protein